MRTEILRVVRDKASVRPLVEKLCAALWDGTTPEEVEKAPGLIWFSADETLVIIEIVARTAGRELFVYGVAGSGMIRNADAICRDLLQLKNAFDCRWIGGHVIRKGLARLYDRLGAREVSRYYLMEN